MKNKTRRARLSNGLTLLHLHTPNDPVSAGHLFFPHGAANEPPRQRGVTNLYWSLLTKGTKRRNARQLAEDIEAIGASISGGASHDHSDVSVHSAADYFWPALSILSEALLEPSTPSVEVDKEKTVLLAGIAAKKENIFTVAYEELNRHLYGSHPYSLPSSGTEDSVKGLTRDDVLRWRYHLLRPEGALFSIASDIPFEKLKIEIERLFGAAVWPKSKAPPMKPVPPPVALARPVSLRKSERFEQAYLMIGFPAAPVGSKDYAALKVLNGILGGGMSARLFQSLREKQGLAYDVGSFYPSRKYTSGFIFYLGLQRSKLKEAKEQIAKEIRRIRTQKVPKDELLQARNYLKGSYILDHQTNGQRAHYIGWWEMLGLGAGADAAYVKALEKVTANDVLKAAKKFLTNTTVTVEVTPEFKGAPTEPQPAGRA